MSSDRVEKPAPSHTARELDEARARRAQEDLALSMSERLAKLHRLCLQATAISGAARKQ